MDHPTDSRDKFEKALEDQKSAKYVLRLYIAGYTVKSTQAILNLREICETHLKGRYELEVIDISQQPELALWAAADRRPDPDQTAPSPPGPHRRRPFPRGKSSDWAGSAAAPCWRWVNSEAISSIHTGCSIESHLICAHCFTDKMYR